MQDAGSNSEFGIRNIHPPSPEQVRLRVQGGWTTFSGGAWHPDSPRVGVPGILTGSALTNVPHRSRKRLSEAVKSWRILSHLASDSDSISVRGRVSHQRQDQRQIQRQPLWLPRIVAVPAADPVGSLSLSLSVSLSNGRT